MRKARSRRAVRGVGTLWLAVGLASASGMGPARPAGAQVTTQVVNGAPELAEPTTAALVQGDAATGFAVCSAVLVGCDAVVTTAHCFNTNPGLKTTLFFQHAGFVPIESATRHPAYVEAYEERDPGWLDVLRVEDVAFVKLAQPVSGIAPSTLGTATPPPGTPGRIVGFGRDPVTEVSSFDPNAGIKRSGSMELTPCAGTLAGFDVLCWEPESPLGPAGEGVSTCNVDSGGPLFVDEGLGRVVAGLTKGAVYDPQGQPDYCLPPVQPYDTRVARHHAWLESMAAATGAVDLEQKQCGALAELPEEVESLPCDGLPWSPGDASRTCGFHGALEDGLAPQAQHMFRVPPETAVLRVALNGIASQTGEVDTDLYLRAGAAPTPVVHDCSATASGNLGFCEIPDPEPGSWYVLVDQVAGTGEYQVSVSMFASVGRGAGIPALGMPGRALLALGLAFAARARLRGRCRRTHHRP